MKTPCNGCMSRHEACHTDCEKYIAFRQRLSDANKARDRDRLIDGHQIEKSIKGAKAAQRLIRK